MWSNSQSRILILALIVAGLLIRLYGLDSQSLWHDEIITFIASVPSLTSIIVDPYHINIPPLYYLVSHLALRFGEGEFILRLPSVLFASLSIPLLFVIFRNLYGTKAGILGAALMAISPFHVWYSQEARPYALLIFLSLLAIWSFQQIVKTNRAMFWQAAFVVSAALTFYTHTVGIALLGVLAIYVIIYTPYKQWRSWLGRFAVIAMLISPAIYRLLVVPPTRSANAFRSTDPLGSTAYTLWAFATGFSLGPNTAELQMPDRSAVLWLYLPIILPIMLGLCSLLALGAIRLFKKDRNIFSFTGLWLVFPLGFAFLGSMLTVHPFNVRYAILSFPAFLAILSFGITNIKYDRIRALVIGMICLVSIGSLGNYFFNERYQRDDNRSASRFLSLHAAPDDLVIVSAAYTAQNLRHYYQGDPIKVVGYPTHKSLHEDHSVRPDPAGALFVQSGHSLAEDMEHITAGYERVWLLLSRVFHSDPYGVILDYFDSTYERQLSASWAGTQLILYEQRKNSMER